MTRFSDATIRARNESAWLIPDGDDRTNHRLRADMRRFADDDEVDMVIVGCGAGGATLMQRLARAGWRVVGLDAGPFWDPDADWVSDEAGSHRLYWTEPRVITGADPVPLGSNNSGRGVGGSMVHYAGYTPRFHPSDFHTATRDGVGADWPIGYQDLRPYYEAIEEELPVSGQKWPWGDPHSYRYSPQPVGGNGEIFLRGAAAIGLDARVGPVAIANGRFGNRPHCIYRGFCLQGCKVNAKASPLITHVPDALAHGAEIRANCMVSGVEIGNNGLATGVRYFTGGVEHFQRARMVAVAGYSIETPRLLLLSTSKRFPDGLCNDEGQVGHYVMVQGAPQTAGRFHDEIRMFKAPPPEVSSEHYYETDPAKPYQRGFSIQTVSPLPITWAEHVAAQGHRGEVLREYMRDYVHWATLGALCEFLPQYDNAVSLADEQDRHGLPVAEFSYSQCDNDSQLMKAAQAVMEQLLTAAGAEEVITINRYAHLVGGCRMAASPKEGVVDGNQRSFAVPNLYITDGSVLPTQGAANPALTIMALAARSAEHLVTNSRAGTHSAGRAPMPITEVTARAYTIPTDQPEADGTLSWNSTTMVVATVTDGDEHGLGWTYVSAGAVDVIKQQLAPVVVGAHAAEIPRLAAEMARACRNVGRPGIAACAISAVDIALWDFRARQMGLALVDLFGRARNSVPVYGSGGFTTYDDKTTAAQLTTWVNDWSIPRVKIKIGQPWGADPGRDLERVALARRVVGDAELYVDANGGYTVKQAIRLGLAMADQHDVTWFEEPVSSDDLAGLRRVAAACPGEVAAGEYGYTLDYFAQMFQANAVDCIQADVTRCGGYSVWRQVAALAEAHHRQLSAHCAPNLHAHVAASIPNLRHLEYFHDHHRIETMLFDGALPPDGGIMTPDSTRPGHGLTLREHVADTYRTA